MTLRSVDARTLKTWLDKNEAVLVDVREPYEAAASSIEGSHLVPLGQLSKSELPDFKGRKLVVYCKRGIRGVIGCQHLLKEDRHLPVYNLEGGINAWVNAGLPVASPAAQAPARAAIDGRVKLVAGLLAIGGGVLGYSVDPGYFFLPVAAGADLILSALTGSSPLAQIVAILPRKASS